MECKGHGQKVLATGLHHWNISRMECKDYTVQGDTFGANELEYIQNGM